MRASFDSTFVILLKELINGVVRSETPDNKIIM